MRFKKFLEETLIDAPYEYPVKNKKENVTSKVKASNDEISYNEKAGRKKKIFGPATAERSPTMGPILGNDPGTKGNT